MKIEDKIRKARAALIMQAPFFGTLALRLRLEITDKVPTAATDGKACYWNPQWADEKTPQELIGVWAHEVSHVAKRHHTRRGVRDPEMWNQAGDYQINPELVQAGFTLPPEGLNDPRFHDQSTDSIYATLAKERPPQGGGGKQGGQGGDGDAMNAPDPGGCGGVMDLPGTDGKKATPAELARAEAEMDVAVVQAAELAGAGNVPGSFARMVDQIKNPQVDWRAILRFWLEHIAKNDYRWSPANRRHIWRDVYLPSRRSMEMGTLIWSIDVSGSITNDQLAHAQAELNAACAELQPQDLWVVYWDTAIQKADHHENPQGDITLEARGGGGTDPAAFFDWIKENNVDPVGAVIMTDLEFWGDFPADPGFPVIWACTAGRKSVPWGELIEINA